MTVTQESSKSPLYEGDGVSTEFAFNFKVLSAEHLNVYTYDEDTETTVLLTKDIDYSVALADEGVSGGAVTTADPLASSKVLRVFRNTPKDQQMNILNSGNFYPSVLNSSADKSVLLIQEIIDKLERAIILDPMSPETPDDLYARIGEALSTANEAKVIANNALSTAQANYAALQDYVNQTLAQWFDSQGDWENPVIWTTTLSAGDQLISTPYNFTQGLFFFGGSTYALNNVEHATLDQSGSNTRILLNEPVLFDGTGILVVLNTNVPLQATWSGSIDAGEDTITTPFTETQLNAGGFLVVGGSVYNLDDVTISGSDVTLPSAVVADHDVILVLLSQ